MSANLCFAACPKTKISQHTIPRFHFDRAVEPSNRSFQLFIIVRSVHRSVEALSGAAGRWTATKKSTEGKVHPLRAGNGQAPVSHDLINTTRPLQLHAEVFIYVQRPRFLTFYMLYTIAFSHHSLLCHCLQFSHHVHSERRESQH
jgi:hypothetical protein